MRRVEIGVVAYPGVQLAAVHGLCDLFGIASRFAAAHATASLHASRWRVDAQGIVPESDESEAATARLDAVVLPPSLDAASLRSEDNAALAGWLRRRHEQGAVLCSVCAGAFLLARTGLLAGRPATTHWHLAPEFARAFPDVRLDADRLLIDDGDLITAGGLMAWTDLGLRLVECFLGHAAMVDTARFLLVDAGGREQRHYRDFAAALDHGDEAILKVQHWLQASAARDADLAAMASRAGLQARSFQRRFRAATGLRPLEYCQRLRIEKARELLHETRRPLESIAWDVGYGDPGTFGKLFQRITGLSPGEYRKRFGLALRRS